MEILSKWWAQFIFIHQMDSSLKENQKFMVVGEISPSNPQLKEKYHPKY